MLLTVSVLGDALATLGRLLLATAWALKLWVVVVVVAGHVGRPALWTGRRLWMEPYPPLPWPAAVPRTVEAVALVVAVPLVTAFLHSVVLPARAKALALRPRLLFWPRLARRVAVVAVHRAKLTECSGAMPVATKRRAQSPPATATRVPKVRGKQLSLDPHKGLLRLLGQLTSTQSKRKTRTRSS